MTITVKLYAAFRTGRFDCETREYPPSTTVSWIVDELKIPRQELGAIIVNTLHHDLEHELREGDTLALLPFLGGG